MNEYPTKTDPPDNTPGATDGCPVGSPNRSPTGRPGVAVVDDCPFYMAGLPSLLSASHRFDEVFAFANVDDALAHCLARPPHVVLIEVQRPLVRSLQLIQQLMEERLPVRVLAMTHLRRGQVLIDAVNAGADGLIGKQCPLAEIINALITVAGGGRYFSPELRDALLPQNHRSHGGAFRGSFSELTPRERDVALHLVEGLTTQAVAQALHVSIKTIDTHRRTVLQKLRIRNVADLTRIAVAEGLAREDR